MYLNLDVYIYSRAMSAGPLCRGQVVGPLLRWSRPVGAMSAGPLLRGHVIGPSPAVSTLLLCVGNGIYWPQCASSR
jgi:hypothetical protein